MALSADELDHLFHLRLVVARVGETDNAGWWASEGVLGPEGRYAYRRLTPRTAQFARARVAFAAARARCEDRAPGGAITLWSLPADAEAAFDERWPEWLDRSEDWEGRFDAVENIVDTEDLLGVLLDRGLASYRDATDARALDAVPPDPVVPLGPLAGVDRAALTRLAAGFACGGLSALVVPYFHAAA